MGGSQNSAALCRLNRIAIFGGEFERPLQERYALANAVRPHQHITQCAACRRLKMCIAAALGQGVSLLTVRQPPAWAAQADSEERAQVNERSYGLQRGKFVQHCQRLFERGL